MIGLIWAQTETGVIGAGGELPWHLPEDLAHFRDITLGAPVVMGRKTWDSLPERFRPLPGRRNIVVTRDRGFSADGAEVYFDISTALSEAQEGLGAQEYVWVIGGAQLFQACLPLADRVEMTLIRSDCSGDTFAPGLGADWHVNSADPSSASTWLRSGGGLEYRFQSFFRT